MAHELAMTNGSTAMMYAGDVPWHGLGTRLHELTSYIRYYNFERLHSSQGYVPPAQFETQPILRK